MSEKSEFVSFVETYSKALEVAARLVNPYEVRIVATTRGSVSQCAIESQDEPGYAVWLATVVFPTHLVVNTAGIFSEDES